MPLRSERPIVRVEPGSMHTIETRNPENLFGLWSVFSKCSPAMEDGKRYENMAWRLWSRETFCCAPDHIAPDRWSFGPRVASNDTDMPELSSSVGSDDSTSESALTTTTRSNSSISRPHLSRHDSANSQARGKHITPTDLEKVVSSIQEKRRIEPLSPLPEQLAQPLALRQKKLPEDTTPRPSSPPPVRYVPDSSTSTVATALGSDGMSPPVGSEASTSTDMSSHSIVHGFDPTRISTSIRSSTNLAPAPTPILKSSALSKPEFTKAEPAKKKKPMFTLGGSSDEDNQSSFEASYIAGKSSLSDHIAKSGLARKTTSFKNEVATRTFQDATSEESEEAIESDSEEESDDNAIEEEDSDEDDWEDDDNSGPSSMTEKDMFHKVDSRPNLTSRRSLLTAAMHEGDRAKALQNAASRSTPAIRRSRTATPNGPSTGNSPQEDSSLMMKPSAARAAPRPIIMTTSNVHPPALSPRTTRRNMLQTELTQSLRQNLLWERQQKNSTTNAVNKRAQSAVSLPALRRAMTTNDIKNINTLPQQAMNKSSTFRDATKNNNSYNDYFDQGLQEYHQKGW